MQELKTPIGKNDKLKTCTVVLMSIPMCFPTSAVNRHVRIEEDGIFHGQNQPHLALHRWGLR